MGFFSKLLIGKVSTIEIPKVNPIQKRILNIKSIWDNDHQDDNGIEKIFRLFLSISQLLFPGIYIKTIASKVNPIYKDLAMDVYILIKVAFPFLILYYHWQQHQVLIYLLVYLLLETILYIPTLIFASDLFSRPRSYKRSMLMLFSIISKLLLLLEFCILWAIT